MSKQIGLPTIVIFVIVALLGLPLINAETIPSGAVITGTDPAGGLVGYWSDSRATAHAFLYRGGSLTEISVPGSSSTFLYGLRGPAMVGIYRMGLQSHGFMLQRGLVTDIDFPDALATFPCSILSTGEVIGFYQDSTLKYQAFLWRGGRFLLSFDAALLDNFAHATTIINFDDRPGFNCFASGGCSQGEPIPDPFVINTQYQNRGVVFNSTGGGVAILNGDNPVSKPNVATPTTTGPAISYTDPVFATFMVGTNSAVVDSVTITLTNSSSKSTLRAFDVNGKLLTSTSGGRSAILTVTAPGLIHSVELSGGPEAFDNFSFTGLLIGP